MQNSEIKIGFITVSDRASRGEYEDLGGPAMQAWMAHALTNEWTAIAKVVADEQNRIESTIIQMADIDGCSLIVTTGGTGPAKRDVTPEATANVCDKILDGFAEQMRAVSLQYVPTAILSRQIAGTRGSTLIINLPGKPSAISECLEAVFPAVPYCIDLIEGGYLETDEDFIKAFRPKHAIKPAHALKNHQG
ncbi:MAG: molybdopterin adenylyltransferase [Pseudomonadota bacterium]